MLAGERTGFRLWTFALRFLMVSAVKLLPILSIRSLAIVGALLLAGCADHDHQLVISVPEQRMALLYRGVPQAYYPVSTSRFCLSDQPGTYGTPEGELEIAEKIGGGLPAGAVLKNREPTGEVLSIDAPGRDPVVTRILWLRGLETRNSRAHDRYIYIHGTPEERRIGVPASFGCVRMRSHDIIATRPLLAPGATVPPPPSSSPAPTSGF